MNPQKLDSFQHKHAEHLFQNPDTNYAVLRESILAPTVEFVQTLDRSAKDPTQEIKSSSGTVFDRSQHADLVAQFVTEESAEAYLLTVFKANTTRYGHHTDVVIENPQLIWTVPTSAYDAGAASLSKAQVSDFAAALVAVEALLRPLAATDLASPSQWTQKELQQAITAAIATLATQYPSPEAARDTVYAALRFASMGAADRASKPASLVFCLLGPEESLKRLGNAAKALARAGTPS